jgi:hypothetical protein
LYRYSAATGLDAPPHGEKVRHCTKMVCMVAGGQDELPWAVRMAIGQGNGKPFMVNRTGFFTKREVGAALSTSLSLSLVLSLFADEDSTTHPAKPRTNTMATCATVR